MSKRAESVRSLGRPLLAFVVAWFIAAALALVNITLWAATKSDMLVDAATAVNKVPSAVDIYGGVLAGHDQKEATGLIHLKKVNGRWLLFTALGNPLWEIAFDNARLGNDLGVDLNGHGNLFWVAEKYALGRGPSRWVYGTQGEVGLLCSADGTLMGFHRRWRI